MSIFSKSTIEKYTQTVGNKNEVDEIMRPILIIQRIFGQQILDPSWTWRRFFPHHMAAAILFIYVAIGTLAVLQDTDDVGLVAEASFTFVITSMCPIKYLLYVDKRILFRKLYADLKSTLYETIDQDQKLQGALKRAKQLVNGIFYTILTPLSSYILRVLWYYLKREMVTVSKTTSIIMPMRTPYYELASIMHIIFMFQAAFTLVMVDMWLVLLMYIFCVACDTTGKILTVEPRQLHENSLEYALRLNEALKKFYEVHVKQVEYLNNLNLMMTWLALIPLLNVALCVCLIFLRMSKGIDWTFMSNVLPVFGELFLYCWFGELIKEKVNNWNTALLNFDWTSMRTKDKKSYYIIISYMNKNFSIKNAIGTDLSLLTMTDVLKSSYQAFTVLQTMEG